MGTISRIATWFQRRPLLVASSQAGALMAAGDLIAQKFVEKKKTKEIDLKRTVRFGMVGFVIVGPLLRTWYGFLERKIVLSTPAFTAMAKMGGDQLILAPIFLFNFICLMGVLNGQSRGQIKSEIQRHYVDIMIRNYQLWPAAQLINFGLVPLQYRVLFAQSVALLWNTYLSYKTNRTEGSQDMRKGKGVVSSNSNSTTLPFSQ